MCHRLPNDRFPFHLLYTIDVLHNMLCFCIYNPRLSLHLWRMVIMFISIISAVVRYSGVNWIGVASDF